MALKDAELTFSIMIDIDSFKSKTGKELNVECCCLLVVNVRFSTHQASKLSQAAFWLRYDVDS